MSRMSELSAECDRLGIDQSAPDALVRLAGALLAEGTVFVGGEYVLAGDRVTLYLILPHGVLVQRGRTLIATQVADLAPRKDLP